MDHWLTVTQLFRCSGLTASSSHVPLKAMTGVGKGVPAPGGTRGLERIGRVEKIQSWKGYHVCQGYGTWYKCIDIYIYTYRMVLQTYHIAALQKPAKSLVLQMDWIGRICIGQRISLCFSPLWIYICTICLGLGIPTNPEGSRSTQGIPRKKHQPGQASEHHRLGS